MAAHATSAASAPLPHTPAADHGAVAADGHVASVEHGGDHGSGGLPQLDMQHWGGQIVWLLLIFTVLYLLLAKVFLPRLRAVRDARAEAISDAVAAARQVQAEAHAQAEAATAEVAKARAEARATAAAAKARVTEQANARQAADEAATNARIAEAEGAIAKARDTAMGNVSTIADDTTKAIVDHLTGRTATAAELTAAKGAA